MQKVTYGVRVHCQRKELLSFFFGLCFQKGSTLKELENVFVKQGFIQKYVVSARFQLCVLSLHATFVFVFPDFPFARFHYRLHAISTICI